MATPKQYDIFISYRRDGGKNYARILKPELEKRGFQDRVFLDFDELKDGKFDKRIMDAIDSAPVFIIILSDGCLDRCVNVGDWVRQEILHALATNKHIVPVVCDKTFNGIPNDVPEVIKKGLGQHQFSQIDTDALLEASVDELVKHRISPIINGSNTGVESMRETGAEIHIMTDADCNVMRFGKLLGVAEIEKDNVIRLIKGNHLLEFVSVAYSDVKQSVKYSVPDNEYSDFIEVKLQELVKEKRKKDLANVPLVTYKDENGKFGYKDNDGNIVIPCDWADARLFDEELAAVQDVDGKWGYIDKIGDLVIPCKWEYTLGFSEGLAFVEDSSEKYGYIDKTGRVVIPCKWEDASDFYEGLAKVQNSSEKYGFIDKTGQLVISCKWEDASNFNEGLVSVQDSSEKWGFVDKTGRVVIPCKWEDVSDFYDGIARVHDEHCKYGFIDKTGSLVIPCVWSTAGFFREGLASVRGENWLAGFIDKTGQLVIPCIWDSVGMFQEGLAYVRDMTGKYGFIDKSGAVVIPCKWNKVGSFSAGIATAYDDDGVCWIIDKTGAVLGKW